jgi:hypothetical protein
MVEIRKHVACHGFFSSLGPVVTTFPGQFATCAVGVELVGLVTPANYTGQVTLKRSKSVYAYYGSTLMSGYPASGPDTSGDPYLDTDPQTGGSAGKVYDIDAPGVTAPLAVTTPRVTVNYIRSNFVEWAVLGDATSSKQASPNFAWWARSACTFDQSGNTAFSYSISGDNQAGAGTTSTSWNLQ